MVRNFSTLCMAFFFIVLINSTASAISLVEGEWLSKNLKSSNVRIVDVQNKPGTYAKEHIPGAVEVHRHIDLGDVTQEPPNLYPGAEEFAELLQHLGINNETIVVAYDDKFGLFASRFLVLMEIYGHDISKLKLLDGGIVNWKLEGRKVNNELVQVASSKYQVSNERDNILITWSDIYRDVVGGVRPEVTLLDVRPENEYKGKKIRGIRGGHLPKAINITGSNANDSTTHKFKSINDIREMYEDQGLSKDSVIYEYCHSGDRAAHTYIQLHHLLGYQNVKLYDGGWKAWNSKLFLPAAEVTWLWDAK